MRQRELIAALSMLTVVGCGGSETEPQTPATAVTPAAPEPAEPEPAPSQPAPPAEPAKPPEPQITWDHGRFVFFEHWTKDEKASAKARAFYTEVFGWTVQEQEMGGQKYHMISSGNVPIGLFSVMPAYKGKAGTWMGYVSVPDVDAAIAAAAQNGGAAMGEAMDLPDVGRFGHLTGPGGAVLGVYKSPKGDMPEMPPQPGGIAWMELWVKNAKDQTAAIGFLTATTGWTTSEQPMGKKKYTQFMTGEKSRAGVDTAKAKDAGAWVPYVMVADVPGAVKKATKAKAKVVLKPKTIETVGTIAVIADPSGAKIGFWQAPEAKPSDAAPAVEEPAPAPKK